MNKSYIRKTCLIIAFLIHYLAQNLYSKSYKCLWHLITLQGHSYSLFYLPETEQKINQIKLNFCFYFWCRIKKSFYRINQCQFHEYILYMRWTGNSITFSRFIHLLPIVCVLWKYIKVFPFLLYFILKIQATTIIAFLGEILLGIFRKWKIFFL